ncbi:GNAT family N-acetyltransferase [Paenibacillus senegalensis]|uniref:GNAT family N-acetyltransferase n=1 Tax=Paenibacillus senegalensis TaxID=1465766 RepID=UPI00028937BD|nr:GNAT family N-acetyltransferase [Paenibacillus senegalensis]
MQYMQYREMTIEDYEQMIELWQKIPGLVLSQADSREGVAEFLVRNPGLSFVCESSEKIAGTMMCGHDGRRGFMYHVAVDPMYRHQQIGKQLVRLGLAGLREAGIEKCHIFVLADNETGNRFWSSQGWQKRNDFFTYSKNT